MMLEWLFGKKKRKWEVPEHLYGYDELAAEFFAMWPAAQHTVLTSLRISRPGSVIEAAKPSLNVRTLTKWKTENQSPMTAYKFIKELRNLLVAERKDRITAVFQQIFRDRNEVEACIKKLENYHKERI